jgi:hypothetical protein
MPSTMAAAKALVNDRSNDRDVNEQDPKEMLKEMSSEEDWSRGIFPLILLEQSTMNTIFGLEASGNEARG